MTKKLFSILIAVVLLISGCKDDTVSNTNKINTKLSKSTIYYFHGNVRCMSCHKIEDYTKEVFNETYNDKLNFKMINVETDENKHFIDKYQLYTKSVVLVKEKDGKEIAYKNLNKVWNYLNNEYEFKSYIKDEINNFLIK